MLGEERKTSSRRWVRWSIAGILLVVVVCAVALTSNSTTNNDEQDAVGDKNMIVGVETDKAMDTPATMDEGNYHTGDEWDDDQDEEADVEDDDDDETDEDDEDVNVVDDGPKKKLPNLKEVIACKKLCGMYFKGFKLLKCQADCKKAEGDFSSARLCFKDCKKACKAIAPKGKKKMCKLTCFKRLCPRPLGFCLRMCRVVGIKHFKNPKGKYIGKCRQMCLKDKGVRSRPKKCKKKCKKGCKKFVKKGKNRRKLCKKECKKLCPAV